MIQYRRERAERYGLFVVYKKSGKVRLIVECRRLNQRLRPPPRTRSATGASLVEIEIDMNTDLWFSAQDIADCYYQFKLPH